MEKLNLYQKLLKISDEIGVVPKNITISLGGGKYKAVGEIDVLNAVKPLEIKYKVLSLPISHEVVESKELEKTGGRIEQFVRVKVVYRFIDTDNPSDFIDTTALGDGVDGGDKASGKAQTYADKYALLKAYKIATGDDPDQEASGEYSKKKSKPTETKEPDVPPFLDVFATTEARVAAINEIVALLGNDQAKVAQWFKHFEINHDTITPAIADTIIARIKKKQNG